MAHQTGIGGNESLHAAFARARTGEIRLMKMGIVAESLVLVSSVPPISTWQQDYDQLVLPCLEESQPCYMMFRFDSRQRNGEFDWLFISYTPENSPVRQKMLYAATRMAVKKEFGTGCIRDELFGTVVSDVDYKGYVQHVNAQSAPKPLTNAEKELELIRQNELELSKQSKRQTVRSVRFPLSPEATDKLQELLVGKINYVQLSLDSSKEVINQECAENIDVSMLPLKIPSDHARYHFFNYSHVYRGQQMASLIFIYSVPGYKCSIKERMLYSTCKSPLLEMARDIGLHVVKNIETDDPKDVTDEFLSDQVHPQIF